MALPNRNSPEDFLKLTNISAGYDQLWVLKNVYLRLGYSEIHAIVGEHGAGKSSLGLIMSGILKPQIGRITFEGNDLRSFNLSTALKLGIRMVQQHTLSLNPHFSVAENLALDSTPFYKWRRKQQTLHAAAAFFAQHRIEIDPEIPVKAFNIPDRIFIDILKQMYSRPKILILDEALEKLAAANFEAIVGMLRELKQAGTSIMLITHRIDDIYNLADRVSILKNGEILVTDEVKNIDKINLIKMAYIQISAEPHVANPNQEFYQLLKYNEAILRNLPVNLIVTDNEHRIKMVNEHCKQHFHLQETPYFNVPLERLFAGDNADALALIQEAFSAREERTFYHVPIGFHQLHTVNNIKTFPIYDGTFLIGHIIIIEDMTEYDHLQKQVMLSEKLASVGLLAAGVAHEINNPLEIIYNYLSYMKYNFHGQELHDAIDNVHEEIASIANIISNLHTFSDKTQSHSEEIDVNDLIQNMLHLIQHHAKDKRIKIHFTPQAGDLTIRANKNEIKQVLLNLFKNSFEAMPSGGEIFIAAAQMIENEAKVVQMTFQDTGPGIRDENPNNIFLPFYSTKKGQENNLGLGLSVSYGIVKKYRGAITVANLEPSGCRFTITLPQSG